jgi:uncharacterized repeat protein (TIGR02543 family)
MKKTLFFLIVVVLLSGKTNAQLSTGLVGYWKLDGSAADATGVNNGSLVGTPPSATGKIGTAYTFAPSPNYYISIANSTSLNIQTNTITLSAWVKPTSNGVQMIVSKISGVGTHNYPYFQYNLQLNQESTLYPRFFLSIGGTAYFAASSSVSMNLNQWYHIAGTYDGTTMRLYLNGSQIATTAVTGNITSYSTPVYIAANGAIGEKFIGTIDEVGIWNRTLTASEVSQLYNSGNGLTYPFETYTLTTTVSPTAVGSITLNPSGGSYSSGTNVTTTAVANSGYTFSGWSGALTGSTNPGTITMNANKTLTATFTPTTTYSLTITAPSNGTITANPAGPNYASGTTVTLTATPNSGYQLSSWGGALSGSTNPTTLLMNGTKTVTATFNPTSSGTGVWQSNGNNISYTTGKVSIGTTIANSASALTVNGKILATEVEVVSNITSDYVFEPAYQLMPLTDLKIYLKQHKHLPGIPSSLEFEDKGQNLGEMQDLLLRKIEELTLYILEQDRMIKELNSKIEVMKILD